MPVHDFKSQRLFVEHPLPQDAVIECTRDQSHYLRSVLRIASGAEILVFNGKDGEWRGRLEHVQKRDCRLHILEQTRAQFAGPDLHYLFAPLKRARLDYMVQKATEMGVARLQPVLTGHTIVDRVNLERMRANVIEAAEQCGVLRVPDVAEPVALTKVIAHWPADRTLFFADEAAEVTTPLDAFEGMETGSPTAVLIGPEGGFTPQEREKLIALQQVRTISLGPRIMRADTAAVALLALVNTAVGDWRAA